MKNKLLVALMLCVFSIGAVAAEGTTYMIEELYAKNTALEGDTVVVKGKVVKISGGIMGKDWVYIQDTSKDPDTNKIFFTAPMDSAKVSVGDNVTATGVVKTNVNLGSGYFYKVLLENSTFKKIYK